MPSDFALDLRNLSREYYNLMDKRSAYVNKLQSKLQMVFPQYLKIFSKIIINTSLTLLEKYTSPDIFLNTSKEESIRSISSTSRFGLTYATMKYNVIIQVTNDAKAFGYSVGSNFTRIHLYIRFIKNYNVEVSSILSEMHELVEANELTDFVMPIHLTESYKGAGFLSSVSLMGKT